MNDRPLLVENARIVDPSRDLDATGSVLVKDGRIAAAGPDALNQGAPEGAEIIDGRDKVVIPGLVDTRVFIGEPGGEHRETIASASRAAVAGGVTSLVMMPDTDPVIDDVALVEFVLKTARDDAVMRIHPAGAITKGLAGAVAFTEGRKTIANSAVLRRAMTYARDFDALIACETQDRHLAAQGVMNEGLFASWLGLPGIPREAEMIPLERDLRLVGLARARYHAAKISVETSADLISQAKQRGLLVTAGVSINHLSLNENDIGEYRTFFKLSPPLRAEDDRRAMVAALKDGTIDLISSSHDPQDVDTKRLPFADAANGAIGLETMLSAALRLYHNDEIALLRLIDAMTHRPAEIFGLDAGTLKVGSKADLAIVDLYEPYVVAKDQIVSTSKNTPFEDARMQGRVLQTVVGGRTVFAVD